MKTARSKLPTEYEEQRVFVKFLNFMKSQGKIIEFHSIPNENLLSSLNRSKAAATQAILKSNGAKSGVPDLFIYLPHKMVVIEMKRKKFGKISKNQKYWLKTLGELPYISSYVAYGAEEAIDIIKKEIKD